MLEHKTYYDVKLLFLFAMKITLEAFYSSLCVLCIKPDGSEGNFVITSFLPYPLTH